MKRYKTHRCETGHKLWSAYVLLRGKAHRDGMKRYNEHLANCQQCTTWKAERAYEAYAAPVDDRENK